MPATIPANHFAIASHFEEDFRMTKRAAIARARNTVVFGEDWRSGFRVLGHIRQHPFTLQPVPHGIR